MNLPDELAPKLRGVSHAWAMWFALVAVVVLALYAPTGMARAAALVYGIGLCSLFAASGLYHRWRWNPRWRPLLRRIDHSTIFIFIAASYTPVARTVLSLPGRSVSRRSSSWRGDDGLVRVGLPRHGIDPPRSLLSYTMWRIVTSALNMLGREREELMDRADPSESDRSRACP